LFYKKEFSFVWYFNVVAHTVEACTVLTVRCHRPHGHAAVWSLHRLRQAANTSCCRRVCISTAGLHW